MTPLPSCPRCASNDRVVALEAPRFSRGKPIADGDTSAWPFECAKCVLLFRGTDAEWARMSDVRHAYRLAHTPKEHS